MRTLDDLTQIHRTSNEARAYSSWLTALAKHPEHLHDRATYFESICRTKAAVAALTTNDFSVYARQFLIGPAGARLLNRLGGFAAPAHVQMQSTTGDPRAEWIADGNPIPCVNLSFDLTTTEASAFGFIVPVTRDLIRSSDDRAVSAVEAIAARALVRTEDSKVLGTDAAVASSSPAGLLASAQEFSDGSPSSVETDLEAMFSFVSDGRPTRPVLVTSPRAALWMALQVTESGARFPAARVDGTGDVAGIPLLTSHAAANRLILIDVGELVVVDNGVEASASTQAAVQMDDSPTTGHAQVVSGFQTGTSFLRFIRHVWWALLRPDAVAFTTISELAGSPA